MQILLEYGIRTGAVVLHCATHFGLQFDKTRVLIKTNSF